MKKTISFLLTAALLLGVHTAYAQESDKMLFNHMGLGITLLGVDGVGINVALPIGNFVQVRAGYMTEAPFFAAGSGIAKGITALDKTPIGEGFSPFNYSMKNLDINPTRTIHVDQIDLTGTVQSHNGLLLFDFFPIKTFPFHITAGAYFSFCPEGLATIRGKMLNGGQPAIKTDIGPNGEISPEVMGVTTDADNFIHLNLQYKMKVARPYVGIGIGSPVNMKNRVGVNFDLGVAYLGGMQAVSYSWYDGKRKDVIIDEAWLNKHQDSFGSSSQNTVNQIKDYMTKMNQFPFALLTTVMPIAKITLCIRLF